MAEQEYGPTMHLPRESTASADTKNQNNQRPAQVNRPGPASHCLLKTTEQNGIYILKKLSHSVCNQSAKFTNANCRDLLPHDCQSPVGESATGPQRKPSLWRQGKAATASNSTQARAAVLMRTCDPVTGSNTGMRAKF